MRLKRGLKKWYHRLKIDTIVGAFNNYVGRSLLGIAAILESKMRNISPEERKPIFIGFSARELAVAFLSIVIFAIGYIFAGRLQVQMIMVGLFVVMGGIAVVGHEMVTDIYARKQKCGSEFKLWGLGVAIVLATAGLFGLVFGKFTR